MDKPSIPDVVDRFVAYLDRPGNGAGGSLHAVIEDGNVSDKDVRFAIERARELGDGEGEELGNVLLGMSRTQRLKLPAFIGQQRRETAVRPPSP